VPETHIDDLNNMAIAVGALHKDQQRAWQDALTESCNMLNRLAMLCGVPELPKVQFRASHLVWDVVSVCRYIRDHATQNHELADAVITILSAKRY